MPTTAKTTLRAVDYLRYSTDMQRDSSIEDQARICQERMQREGWRYVRSYQDRAMSSSTRWRPDFQQVIDDARRGQFDVLVAEALDRLSRDQEDLAHLYKQLAFAEVRIFTLSEGWITELHVGLSGTMGALFLKQLAEKTRRGLRGRVEAGRSGGGNSYGYDVVRKHNADGEADRGLRVINPQHAAVVVEIMTDYAAGKSPRAIVKALNARGIAGPSGGTWCPSAINGNAERGTGILNNEMYVGRLVWNRLRYMKNPSTGKRQSRLNPPEDWIIKDVPELRIAPQDLWDSVKARQKATAKDTRPDKPTADGKARPAFWEQQRPRYLLSGLMKCGCCGANFTKYGASRFACAGSRDRGTCTNKLTIRGDELEAAILASLQTRLMEPARFEKFAADFVAETNKQRMSVSAAKAGKEAALGKVERQIKRLVDAIVDGADAQPLNAKLKELDAERNRLASELKAAPEEKPLIHPAMAIAYRQRVAALAQALYDEEFGRQAFERLRALVEAVVLTPVDGQLAIELRGELAGILRVAGHEEQVADFAKKNALQIKVVAGGHNLLMVGPPGSGKSMLAARLPSILPPLTPEEMLEVSMVHSLAGELLGGRIAIDRPFRAPHHSASMASLVGGGSRPRPGEVSLAHLGVLFLDELPEFQPNVLDALRQPLETGETVIARANHRIAYPSRIQLIAAMNPCKCGGAGPGMSCKRGPRCAEDYQARISGPLLDRIDLQIEVPAVSAADLALPAPTEGSIEVRARVAAARERQRTRLAEKGIKGSRTNSDLAGATLDAIATPDAAGVLLLKQACDRLGLTARGYHRTLKVARTLADLDGADVVGRIHIAEALSYRGETLRQARSAA